MAFKFRTNNTPTNHTYSAWITFQTLMDAGWSCLAWSDGTTANLTGTIPGPYAAGPGAPDPVFPQSGTFPTSGSAGTNGLGNTRAWILLRQPKATGSVGNYAGTRMFVIQRGTTSALWKMKYSKAGNYGLNNQGPIGYATSQNAPSIVPSLTNDEFTMTGGGTDASPTFNTNFYTADGTSRHNCMANDGLSGETEPFGWLSVSWAAGGGVYCHQAWMFDPMLNGTTVSTDVDPFILFTDGSNQNAFRVDQDNSLNGNLGNVFCWFRYGMSNPVGTAQAVAALAYTYRRSGVGQALVIPGDGANSPLGTNSQNGYDDLFPVIYVRPGNQGGNTGYKGVSSMLRWLGSQHTIGDTFALLTTRDKLSLVTVAAPWDATVPLI